MRFNLESMKQSIGESRTKESALKCIEMLVDTFSDLKIEINKDYHVSEWSWQPIVDGYYPSIETIRFNKRICGIDIYATGTSCRTYFAWDLFDSENECREMCRFKDSFGYNWNMALSGFKESNGVPWDFERCFE